MPSISQRVMIPAEEYQGLVATVLMEFQWLEESLKQYLRRTEAVIQDRVKDDFRYEPSVDNIGKLSLGKLLIRFEKHCGNSVLIDRIKPLIKERNEVAHTSFVFHIDENNEMVTVEALTGRLKKVGSVVRALSDEVTSETRRVEERAPHLFGFSRLIKPN